jgi:hypothetical protein
MNLDQRLMQAELSIKRAEAITAKAAPALAMAGVLQQAVLITQELAESLKVFVEITKQQNDRKAPGADADGDQVPAASRTKS